MGFHRGDAKDAESGSYDIKNSTHKGHPYHVGPFVTFELFC